MKKLSKNLLLCAVFAFVFASCNQANTKDGKNANSDKKGNEGVELKVPEITKITVNEEEITDKRDWLIALENKYTKVQKENIKIDVSANGKTFKEVAFSMFASETSTVVTNEIALKEGEAVSIFLKIAKTDSYKEASHTIRVMRKRVENGDLASPEITKITVNEKEITDKRDWLIALENKYTKVQKENIKIDVSANGKTFKEVAFSMFASETSTVVTNEIALKEGEAVSIFLKIAKTDSYKEASHTIRVMREKIPDAVLKETTILVHTKKVENGEVKVPYAISSVKAGNVNVTFNVANVTVQIKNADKDGEVKLEEGKKTSVVLTVDAVQGKHGSWEKEIFVIREKNKEAKLQVESLNLYGGMNEWGTISYDTNPTALKFNVQSNSWEANKPNDKDAIKFSTKIKAKNIEASKITAKLFKGFLKNGTVEYTDEETNNATSGTPEGTDLIVFNFDNTNCKNSSVKNYYKIEFFIEGKSNVSVFIKLK